MAITTNSLANSGTAISTSDLTDPDLYRLNRVLSDLSARLNGQNSKIESIKQTVNPPSPSPVAKVDESLIANSEWLLGVSGTNDITGSTAIPYTSIKAGFVVRLVPANTNTGAVTINVNSSGIYPVTRYGATALSGGEMSAGTCYLIQFDGVEWQIIGLFPIKESMVADAEWLTGVAGTNTITGTTVVAYTSLVAGFVVRLIPANSNTGAVTLDVNGIGAQPVIANGVALTGGELVIGLARELLWDGASWQILGFSSSSSGTTGSWTPDLNFGGANTGITYSLQNGHYYNFGVIVVATFDITLTSKGVAVGLAEIFGLPFSPSATEITGGAVQYCSNMLLLTSIPSVLAELGTTKAALFNCGAAGSTNLTDANFTNTSRMIGTVIYTK